MNIKSVPPDLPANIAPLPPMIHPSRMFLISLIPKPNKTAESTIFKLLNYM